MSEFFTAIQPIIPITFGDNKAEGVAKTESAVPFADLLTNAVSEYEKAEQASQQDVSELAAGSVDNLAQVQIDSMKAQTALQTTVQLTSKMVNAYKEIMQMQI